MTESIVPTIANSRMYNLSPKIRGLWDALFAWLGHESSVAMDIVAHASPAPLSDLWARPDMGAVFMCGYPFSQLKPEQRPLPLAAPVSTADWGRGKPLYASRVITARNSALTAADLQSARWGWTVRDSQSGYHAPREFAASLQQGNSAFETVGPLLNPTGVAEAIASGRADVGAIDAYAYQLMEMHEPQMIADLRVIATTAPAPFPMLVAARRQPAEIISALRQALWSAHKHAKSRAILSSLGLSAFTEPDLASYENLPARARRTDEVLSPW
ncbi:phosphate/phosphite/phosphonate ABC transporter substrate-binding protein [Neorhizobium sp. IRS_2294]|uniref:phosphate/phosphite/phosphonate ABC transporter substrate-binding protein n=1 Tax=unclassified Neorhizobium TaxID=2629175 RepID=UPI003D28E0C1